MCVCVCAHACVPEKILKVSIDGTDHFFEGSHGDAATDESFRKAQRHFSLDYYDYYRPHNQRAGF